LLYTLFSMVFNFAWQISGPYFGVYQVTELGATRRLLGSSARQGRSRESSVSNTSAAPWTSAARAGRW
jgi:hypothetical protein